jgi:hypothetical protein
MALPHYQKNNKSASIIMHLVELDERFWYEEYHPKGYVA